MTTMAISSSFMNFSGNREDNSSKIESLRREKERLEQEIADIRSDATMNEAEKKLKLQTISTKINTISGKIQNISHSSGDKIVRVNFEDTQKMSKLTKEKMKLQLELREINTSTTMNAQEKNKEKQKIMMEINSIQNEIRSLTIEDVHDMQYVSTGNVSGKEEDTSYCEDIEEKIRELLGFNKDDEKKKGKFLNRIDILV